MHNYAERHDGTASNLWSRSDAITFIGSDGAEFFEGDELCRRLEAFTQAQAHLTVEVEQVKAFEAGAFGWAHSRLTVHAPESGMSVTFRNTFIYTLEDAVWRLVHVHNSNPRPNIDTMGYVTRGLDELLTAAQSAPLDLGQTGIASIMFTDIVGSTALAAAVGDAKWHGLVRGHLRAVEEHVAAQGGTLVKSLGDGTMSTCPSARSALTAAQIIP